MGRLLTIAWALAATLGLVRVHANELDFSFDLRAVTSSGGQNSYLNGGLGKLRFDENHGGLRLGLLRAAWRTDLTANTRLTAEGFAWGDGDRNALDLTELYLSYRPVPQSLWRSEWKVGAFYPAISLENRMRGWRSPYSLSASAINTWVGEELRTIGVEYGLDWLGQQADRAFNAGLVAAVYGFNDPIGVVIARRGWSLHDRQTTLFGRVGTPGSGPIDGRTIFYHDIDGSAGGYAGVSLNYRGRLELRALRYNNRGDPAAPAPAIDDYAWKTMFNSVGLRYTPDEHWTVIAQRMVGRTYVGAASPPNCWAFDGSFVLASWLRGRTRLSYRHDWLAMDQHVSTFGFYNRERGAADTLALNLELGAQWRLGLEWLQIDSTLAGRVRLGLAPRALEQQWQLALGYELRRQFN